MLKNLIYSCFAVLLFTACGDDPVDPCADVDCGANGMCLDGTCDCEDGYSGTNCEIFDPCFSVDCGENGQCVDGTCACDDGYYGDSCENLIQELFVGTWNGLDCDGDDYTIVISAGEMPLDLIIVNSGLEIAAVIESDTTFNVPTQVIIEPFFQTEVTVFGNGILQQDGKLSFTADVQSAFGGGVCTSEMTLQ